MHSKYSMLLCTGQIVHGDLCLQNMCLYCMFDLQVCMGVHLCVYTGYFWVLEAFISEVKKYFYTQDVRCVSRKGRYGQEGLKSRVVLRTHQNPVVLHIINLQFIQRVHWNLLSLPYLQQNLLSSSKFSTQAWSGVNYTDFAEVSIKFLNKLFGNNCPSWSLSL